MSSDATLPLPAAAVPMRPHRRQFVVGSEPVTVYDDWRKVRVGDLWLSHCPALPAAVVRDADGVPWALLGRALQTAAGAPDPAAQLPTLRSAEVVHAYQSWAGRWVLVGQNQIHPDGGALLGIFHGKRGDGEGWASSSPALLAQKLFAGEPPAPARRLKYEVGLTWFAPPCSAWSEARRLLPSQVLEVRNGVAAARPLMPPLKSEPDFDAAIAGLAESMTSAARSLARQVQPIWISLSAGFDSRVVLAMARAAGVPAQVFTRLTPRTPLADRRLPPLLAQAAGLPHRFMRGGRVIESRREVCRIHAAGHVSQGDADPLLRGARDELLGALLGGWCVESGNGFLSRALVLPQEDCPEKFLAGVLEALGESERGPATGELRQWLDWAVAHPHAGLSLRDRLHLEQRIGGWMSSKEQINDLLPVERISLFNCAHNYATLLGLPDELRKGKTYGRALVKLAAPELGRLPFNPSDRQIGWGAAVAHRLQHPLVTAARSLRNWRRRLRLG